MPQDETATDRGDGRLLFGFWGGAILAAGVAVLPVAMPGYDPMRQTVSEIGKVGSPAQTPYALLLVVVGTCVGTFALGLLRASARARRSRLAAYVTTTMVVSMAGLALFPIPQPLHNVFGLSELIPYQAPWVLAVTWRREGAQRPVVIFSWMMTAVISAAILANLMTVDRDGALFAALRPIYGLIQRSLLGAWFAWCAGVGLMLWARPE